MVSLSFLSSRLSRSLSLCLSLPLSLCLGLWLLSFRLSLPLSQLCVLLSRLSPSLFSLSIQLSSRQVVVSFSFSFLPFLLHSQRRPLRPLRPLLSLRLHLAPALPLVLPLSFSAFSFSFYCCSLPRRFLSLPLSRHRLNHHTQKGMNITVVFFPAATTSTRTNDIQP